MGLTRTRWWLPLFSVFLGVLCLTALWIGDDLGMGLFAFGLMAAIAGAIHIHWLALLVGPFAILGFFAGERRRRLEQLQELNRAYRGTALVLGDVVEQQRWCQLDWRERRPCCPPSPALPHCSLSGV